MLAAVLPGTITEEWIAKFAGGLAHDQDEYNVHLIGGDTNSTPGPLTITIMAFGDVPTGRILRRGGARDGDTVFVTGTIGDAALGLEVLQAKLTGLDADAARFLADRYRLPQPRVALGPRLIGLASAALDVSDGLLADLRHLCEVSELDAVVEGPRVPLSKAARLALSGDPGRMATVLTGGDDYEILFTARPEMADALGRLSQTLVVPITAIGRMASTSTGKDRRVTVLGESGEPLTFDRAGWTHF
jgi:thiamine-monophosphate kinase